VVLYKSLLVAQFYCVLSVRLSILAPDLRKKLPFEGFIRGMRLIPRRRQFFCGTVEDVKEARLFEGGKPR